MIVHLHIMLGGVKRKHKQVSVELPDGATVRHALAAYAEQYPAPFDLVDMNGILVLRNRSLAWFGDLLADGDVVTLLRAFASG